LSLLELPGYKNSARPVTACHSDLFLSQMAYANQYIKFILLQLAARQHTIHE